MRFLLMVLGLLLLVAAGLYFFTPVLDPVYSRHARQPQAATRSAAPQATAPRPGATATAPDARARPQPAPQPVSKLSFDSVLNILNLGFGLVGAWFTYLGYRLQKRAREK
jgi:hypothetical protein